MEKPLLIINIGKLGGTAQPDELRRSGADMDCWPAIENAWLMREEGAITGFGRMSLVPQMRGAEVLDAAGANLMPAFVDSHTHIVFAAWRENEFEMRIRGKSYEEIFQAGGGILNSAARVQKASENDLYNAAKERLDACINQGTGAIEVKSGYGLSVDSELKMLRVIRRLAEEAPIPIKATFLGAHAIPAMFRQNREAYLKQIEDEMLPAIATEKLADFMDVFCERNYFTQAETERLLNKGREYGLIPKVHANQLSINGGVQAAVNVGAISADHLENIGDDEVDSLKGTGVMPVGLPICSLFLGIPYMPARRLISEGLPVAIATDFNPGSSPSGDMRLAISLACTQMKMTPAEALNAATINAAAALGISDKHGKIALGAKSSLIVMKKGYDFTHIPYALSMPWIDRILH